MDCRDTGHTRRWYDDLDDRAMRATFTVMQEDGEEVAHEVRVAFKVCPTCRGKGKHVNPNIDRNGITEDEWGLWSDEDRESYLTGGYDVECSECGGRRVVPVPTRDNPPEVLEAIRSRLEDAAEYARECASEARYCYGSDY